MSQKKDDPRRVLAVLNSLGFVGITAEQLKAFMKDLKMHRKRKEREKQEWKEEMMRKILMKQRQAELGENNDDGDDDDNDDIGAKENFPDDSVVKIRIRCVPGTKKNDEPENKRNQIPVRTRVLNSRRTEDRSDLNLPLNELRINSDRPKRSTNTERQDSKSQPELQSRTLSAPDLTRDVQRPSTSKSNASEPTGRPKSTARSRCSSRSQSKSFIRPWKLHPEIHRPAQSLKTDPVALYQQYQKEWKQVSFPGENQHADVRWAVREKMMGIDPTPRPILKKSCSTTSVRRR